MPALSPQPGRWCANLSFPGGARGWRDGHPVQRLRRGDDVLELAPTITVRRLWAACQLSPGLSISAPCHMRPAGLSSCRASCRCTCPTGASGTALPDVRRASLLEAPRHPVLLVTLPATGLSQATGCCGHSPRHATLSRATSPLASLASSGARHSPSVAPCASWVCSVSSHCVAPSSAR
jgi:hypothetical protein